MTEFLEDDGLERVIEARAWRSETVAELGVGWDGSRVLIPSGADRPLRYWPNGEPTDGRRKMDAPAGAPRRLFPPPHEHPPPGWAIIVEGEPDAICARSMGLPAYGVPGTSGWRSEWATMFAGQKVAIVCDCDVPGRKAAQAIAADLHGVAAEVRIVDLDPSSADGYDVTDVALEDGLTRARDLILGLVQNAPQWAPEATLDEQPRDRPLRVWTLAELASLPPAEWLVEGVIEVGAFGMLYGPSGAGKTVVSMDLGLSIATGIRWMGRETRPGLVVYLAGEGKAGIRKRATAWADSRKPSSEARFRVIAEGVSLLDAASIVRLEHALEQLPEPPVLLIVDTLARAMPGGEENSARDAGVVIAHLDHLRERFGMAVLLVHHTGVNETRERGSTAWGAASDVRMHLAVDGTSVILRCAKQKDHPEFPDMTYHLEPHLESVVLAQGKSRNPIGATERTILRFVREAFPDATVSKRTIIDAVDVKRTAAYEAMRRLVDAGYLTASTQGKAEYVQITQRGRAFVDQDSSVSSADRPDDEPGRNGDRPPDGRALPPKGGSPRADESPAPLGLTLDELDHLEQGGDRPAWWDR